MIIYEQSVWNDNSIQFARLLAEIKAVGLSSQQMRDLCASMDLEPEQVRELLDRAEEEFERCKEAIVDSAVNSAKADSTKV